MGLRQAILDNDTRIFYYLLLVTVAPYMRRGKLPIDVGQTADNSSLTTSEELAVSRPFDLEAEFEVL
jgi:hypothetical protein